MAGGTGYRPVDPAAYGGRPRAAGASLRATVFVTGFVAACLFVADGPWWAWLLVLGFGALSLRRILQPLLRPTASPFVVDAPGVWVGDDGVRENEERLVHWESIAEIVFFRAAVRCSRDVHDVVGLRLRRHPDVVAIRRVLDSWSLDRTRVEAAVARFAPGVRVVDGPDELGAAAVIRRAVEAQARPADAWRNQERSAAGPGPAPDGGERAPAGGSGRRFVPVRRTRYQAEDSRAYVVRPTWFSAPVVYVFLVVASLLGVLVGRDSIVVGVLVAVGFSLPFLLHVTAIVRGSVRFAVDAPGVFFGEAHSGERAADHRLVPWAEIASVTLFDVEQEKSWARAVGVTRARPGGGEPELGYHRVLNGWRLDRVALEAAVLCFAPQVPVVDGPPVGRARRRDVAGARPEVDEWQRRGGPQR